MRWLLTMRYDGRRYHGWQVQPNGVTVQACLQDALEAVFGYRPPVTGCSRTDAGVSADMFCAAADIDCGLHGDKLCAALNAHLPRDIAVYEARVVPPAFHPRYDAKGKQYTYTIWNGRVRNPVYEQRAWHITSPLSEERMHEAAQAFLGTHDFSSFRAAGSQTEGSVRTVCEAKVVRAGDLLTYSVSADGFLYHMVRIMTGTLVDVAQGRIGAGDLPQIIASGNRENAGMTAPPQGLCLTRVFYDEQKLQL